MFSTKPEGEETVIGILVSYLVGILAALGISLLMVFINKNASEGMQLSQLIMGLGALIAFFGTTTLMRKLLSKKPDDVDQGEEDSE